MSRGPTATQSDPRRSGPGKLLTPEQVSELTALSIETLAQWRCRKRGIPYVKISRNCVRYRESDLDKWLSERIVPVQTEARRV